MADPGEQRKAQVKALFDAVSPEYDSGPGCFAHFGQRLVDIVHIPPRARVLDVATGHGAVLFPAAERAGDGAELIGIDLSDAMVQATNEAAKRRGLAARVSVMDAESLLFPDESFDCVLCGFGIMFFPNQNRGVTQMHRVLKPGGCLGVSTWRISQAGSDELKATLLDLGFDVPANPGWISEAEVLEQLLARNGFTDIRVQVDSHDFNFADVEELWQVSYGTGLRRVLGQLDLQQKQHVLSEFAERVKPYRTRDGFSIPSTALLAIASR